MTKQEPLFAATCLALLALGLPAASAAQPSEAAVGLAREVTRYPAFREALADSFRADLPPGAAIEIGLALLADADALWSAMEHDLAVRLDAGSEPSELAATAERFAQQPSEAWQSGGETYLALGYDVTTEATETGRHVGIVACLAGIFGSNIDLARQKAAENGQTIVIDDAFMARMAPLLASATLTCTCMLDRTRQQFGDQFMGESDESNAQQRLYAQQLVATGECPNPFAGLPADG